MVTKHIFFESKQDEWKSFRNKKLWTLECNDVFLPNLDKCNQLMKRYMTPGKQFFTYEDALKMLTEDLDLSD